ncbi:pro-glucagon-like isoform X2 [Polyodon spathula]|uniref:pro-glucagon-like isoform X2 n=1 Tax=Polyodon spathula TaxID=7913 RepID=UPI001B7E3422|nr:pro-glucagon-like isoform X2 [Polyodon spathula]
MKGIHSLAGLLLWFIVQGSWQIPLQEREDKPRFLKMREAELSDEARELSHVKRHSQGMFTNDYSKYLEEKLAQEFVEWLKNGKSKRSGEITNQHADGTYTIDFSSFLQDQAARDFVSWLKKGQGRRDVAEELRKRHGDGSFTHDMTTALDSIAAKEFLNWVMNSKPSEASSL